MSPSFDVFETESSDVSQESKRNKMMIPGVSGNAKMSEPGNGDIVSPSSSACGCPGVQ